MFSEHRYLMRIEPISGVTFYSECKKIKKESYFLQKVNLKVNSNCNH